MSQTYMRYDDEADSLIAKGYIVFSNNRAPYRGEHDLSVLIRNCDKSADELPYSEKRALEHAWDSALAPTYRMLLTAHWVLQNPEVVKGKSVLELAAGAGTIAIAAARAGAKTSTTIDLDGEELVKRNAAANGVAEAVTIIKGNIFSRDCLPLIQKADVISLCGFFNLSSNSFSCGVL